MRPVFWTFGISLFIIMAFTNCSTMQPGAASATGVYAERPLDCPAKFVVALTTDLQGNIWAGTEDHGVFRYSPQANGVGRWTQFSVIDGLGDDHAYAVACDRLGRIWVGHLNHGVSVFNGKTWRNYSVLADAATGTVAGPLGVRVFSMTTNPRDGDVWIATEAGLSRYSLQHDTWTYYSRQQGLPCDQASSLAFDMQGNLIVGTSCDGIAIGASKDDYKKWTVIRGRPCTPPTSSGTGLPTDQINRVLVASDGCIYAGTSAGLAWSRDGGTTWTYLRGRDYADKIKGLYVGPPCDWAGPTEDQRADLLLEDYVLDLAEDERGTIWIAHRQQGYEAIDPKTHRPLMDVRAHRAARKDDYVMAIMAGPHSPVIIGRYGDGLAEVGKASTVAAATSLAAAPPPLPLAATLPTLQDIQTALDSLDQPQHLATKGTSPVVALPDDWQTQGDWLGRYGRYWACICGVISPENYVWGAGAIPYSYVLPASATTRPATHGAASRPFIALSPRITGIDPVAEPVSYSARLGPHHEPGDSMRYWVHWLYTTNHSTLELPPTYLHSRVVKNLSSWQLDRREAEINDHGEPYPRTYEGPDLYFMMHVPNGQFVLSLYDFNKDGHVGANRWRDNFISIRKHGNNSFSDIDDFIHQPELARARVRNFWGGVYKKFLVQGPIDLTIKLDRNYSFDTILSGVFLDRVDEKPDPYFPVATRDSSKTSGENTSPAAQILAKLDGLRITQPAAWAAQAHPLCAQVARWAAADPRPDVPSDELAKTLGTCLYHLCYFDGWEIGQQAQGLTTARQIEKSLRWDLKTESYHGMEHQLIVDARQGKQSPAYVLSHAADDYDVPANARVRDCTKGLFSTPCKEYRNQAGEVVALEKYDHGHLAERELYKDGKPHGIWTTYSTAALDADPADLAGLGAWPTYKPGQLATATPYLNGVMHGYVDRFDDRGQLVCHSWIDHGNGVLMEYYSNGRVREETQYKDGKPDGYWTRLFENGQIYEDQEVSEGMHTGPYFIFFEDGAIWELGTSDDKGELHGPVVIFQQDGNLRQVEYWVHGTQISAAAY